MWITLYAEITDIDPGTLPWTPQSTIEMSQVFTEAKLYRQLARCGRLLNPDKAFRKVTETVLPKSWLH